ncbi:serine hydrolase domain-containing protein [Kribbella sp. NPDC056345]|uniref:serine hydrolase domain-containing protein n=1 Tax=Kribbella sp. NPDC056345 TaxID=3345789 RepID=UPI0035DCF8AF
MIELGDLQGLADRLVASGEVPGAVVGVTDGREHRVVAAGTDGPGGGELTADAVFRISSMTKPLAAVLTLQLVEAGVLGLQDPIERWLPELAGQRVVRRLDGPLDDTVPAEHAPTVEDLLVMRLGFGFAFEVESCPVAEAAGGLGLGPPKPSTVALDPDRWIARFGELPLMEQPGRHWRYELAYGVLGVLLSRASGIELPELFHQRLFEPLGMRDSGFVVPEHARDRLVQSFVGTEVFDDAASSDWLTPPDFPHAGGGLVSTAGDYLRFVSALLNGELLRPDLAAAMVSDQLTAEQCSGASAQIFLDGGGWGYGVQVVGTRYGWGGGLGTLWYSYPEAGIGAVLMTQVLPPSPATIAAFADTVGGWASR